MLYHKMTKEDKIELKTLKDLKIAGHEIVRKEAMKWVKKYFPINKKGYQFTLEDFMEFHNITEEDLK